MTYKAECRQECLEILVGRDWPSEWVKGALFEIAWFMGNFHPKIVRARARILWINMNLTLAYVRLGYYHVKAEVHKIRWFFHILFGI